MQRKSIEEIVAREFGSVLATDPTGLCKTCDRADKCKLPERQSGTWHCRDFDFKNYDDGAHFKIISFSNDRKIDGIKRSNGNY